MDFYKIVVGLDTSNGETAWDPSLILARQLELSPHHVLLLEEELLEVELLEVAVHLVAELLEIVLPVAAQRVVAHQAAVAAGDLVTHHVIIVVVGINLVVIAVTRRGRRMIVSLFGFLAFAAYYFSVHTISKKQAQS